MDDLISRQAAIDEIDEWIKAFRENVHKESAADARFIRDGIIQLPSAQPQSTMGQVNDTVQSTNDCISRSELYKKVCEAEKLARERVLDTPSDSPFPNKLNPAYTRYSAQLDERTQFKHMIADARSVQPEIIRCKDCKHFEHNHPYIIQGVPVLGHEVCTAWGDGCKTSEDGYCFLAERRE